MTDENNRIMIQKLIYNTTGKRFNLSQDQFSPYDLYLSDDIAVELKQRYCTSDAYNDNMCETFKVQKLMELKQQGIFKRLYLISTYTDGIIRVSQIKDGDTIQRNAQHNTYFDDKSIRQKEFFSIKTFTDYRVINDRLQKIN